MRYLPVILISFFCLICTPCLATEAILVKIVSVDRVKGRMTVQVLNPSGSDAAAEQLTVLFSPDQLPKHLEIGDTMRLWGNYLQEGTNTFQAQAIRGHYGRKKDPTGVRSRLGKYGRRGMGRGGGHKGPHR
jgi:hypothetical protein